MRGVPRFVDAEHYADSFGTQWNRWSSTQLDSRNGTSIFRERFERYFGDPAQVAGGLRVLDAGCGPGAFLDVLAPHAAELVGLDLSRAVDAAHANTAHLGHVRVAQADLLAPPVAPASFDLVVCIGVLQHTPDPAATFASLARLVRPGGRLAVWAYERTRCEALKPRHTLRRWTSRMEPDRAMRFVEGYAPRAMRVRSSLKKLPAGRVLAKAVPVADMESYAGRLGEALDAEQLREWSLMDTHDMLITRYDQPQKPARLRELFLAHGFEPPRHAPAEGVAMMARRRAPVTAVA